MWEIAASRHGVVTVAIAGEAGVPAVEVRKLATRGALRRYGQGVYVHQDVPTSRLTEPAVAVALGGDDAFLHRESVFDLLGVGQFNPKKIRVGTRRRVRRTLPEWMSLETRADVLDDDITTFDGVATTTVSRALADVRLRMPRERWTALIDETLRRELINAQEALSLRGELE
ncbi:type IV toxin-antitoxin system AbiEi family antitoxin domain-containing protein [Herbiconiux sp. CPCC 205763]|uniref:Type IV toxin-antitoxin system AbiEi family antitoxin domain-containing protein n=1 Tax=Herbiconiux aconitum TaxID=2970913 RepID=A0ABT2GRD4_9MICO|nr:type IV toxin-antitoxin system AbiEi family antitoxin domain-containing protein [Herbiconiux aconitum]MCS5718783.1 type IV toxin-antitoxin system AbiEi family antitoxin domain-containing protein [Herbiconiux aconitum]